MGLSSLAVGAGDPSGSIFDMQLPIAGLQLLAGLLAHSTQAMDWVAQQPDRCVAGAEGARTAVLSSLHERQSHPARCQQDLHLLEALQISTANLVLVHNEGLTG